MKTPQVINLNEDKVLCFDGDNVIDDTDQLPLGKSHQKTSISVQLDAWDLMSNSHVGPITEAMLEYHSEIDCWTMDVSTIFGFATDRHKYVMMISATDDSNMRDFKVNEFCIDNDSFEATLMRLPYQIEIGGGEAWMRWYATTGDFGNPSLALYEAKAFEGGVGITYATDVSRVTHRGPIVSTNQPQ